MLDPRPEYLLIEDLDEDRCGIKGCTVLFDRSKIRIRGYDLQHIHPHRSLVIRGVEDDDIFGPFLRCEGDDIFDQIPVRIDDTESVPVPKVLPCQISDEDRFSASRFSDDVMVPAPIFPHEVDRQAIVAVFVPPHEHRILEDRESSEEPLLVLLHRCQRLDDRLPLVFAFFLDLHQCPVKQVEVPLLVPQEILVLVDLEELPSYGIDIAIGIPLVIREDRRIDRHLEIRRRRNHLILEPFDRRRFVVVYIREMIER